MSKLTGFTDELVALIVITVVTLVHVLYTFGLVTYEHALLEGLWGIMIIMYLGLLSNHD